MVRTNFLFLAFIFLLFFSCKKKSKKIDQNHKEDFIQNTDSNTDSLSVFDNSILEKYIEKEEIDLAIDYIEKIYNENPDDIDILIKRADIYYRQNQTSVSKDCWEHCLEIDPNNNICAEKLIELYCPLYDVTGDNCEKSIEYLLEIDSTNLTALYFKAKLKKDRGENELAKRIYEDILDLNSSHLGALEDLALLYTYENNDLAIQYFERLLKEEEANNYKVYYNYGYYFQLKEDFVNAIEKYQVSISLNENWPYSYYSQGYCYLASAFSSKDESKRKELLKEALNSFDITISLDGGYLEAYHSRAICYQNLGNNKAAMEDFKFCLMIEPGYEPAMNGISELEKMK